MADWTDGPEYAPRVRPEGFAAPDAEPLLDPTTDASLLTGGTPDSALQGFAAPNAPPLSELAAPPAEQRDPTEAFTSVRTPLSSLGPAPTVDRTPQQPFALTTAPLMAASEPPHAQLHVNPEPFPTSDVAETGGWYAAPAPVSDRTPITLRTLVEACGVGLITCLALGALVALPDLGILTPFLFLTATVLAGSAKYRRSLISGLLNGGGLIAVVLAVLRFLDGWPLGSAVDTLIGTLQLESWLFLVIVPFLVYGALRRGDAPQP